MNSAIMRLIEIKEMESRSRCEELEKEYEKTFAELMKIMESTNGKDGVA